MEVPMSDEEHAVEWRLCHQCGAPNVRVAKICVVCYNVIPGENYLNFGETFTDYGSETGDPIEGIQLKSSTHQKSECNNPAYGFSDSSDSNSSSFDESHQSEVKSFESSNAESTIGKHHRAQNVKLQKNEDATLKTTAGGSPLKRSKEGTGLGQSEVRARGRSCDSNISTATHQARVYNASNIFGEKSQGNFDSFGVESSSSGSTRQSNAKSNSTLVNAHELFQTRSPPAEIRTVSQENIMKKLVQSEVYRRQLSAMKQWKQFSKDSFRHEMWLKQLARQIASCCVRQLHCKIQRRFQQWKESTIWFAHQQLSEKVFKFASKQREWAMEQDLMRKAFSGWRLCATRASSQGLIEFQQKELEQRSSAFRKFSKRIRYHQLAQLLRSTESHLRSRESNVARYFGKWKHRFLQDRNHQLFQHMHILAVLRKREDKKQLLWSGFQQWKTLTLWHRYEETEVGRTVLQVKSQLCVAQIFMRMVRKRALTSGWSRWLKHSKKMKSLDHLAQLLIRNCQRHLELKTQRAFFHWKLLAAVRSMSAKNLTGQLEWSTRVVQVQEAGRAILQHSLTLLLGTFKKYTLVAALRHWAHFVKLESAKAECLQRKVSYCRTRTMVYNVFSSWKLQVARDRKRKIQLYKMQLKGTLAQSQQLSLSLCFASWSRITSQMVNLQRDNKRIAALRKLLQAKQYRKRIKEKVIVAFLHWKRTSCSIARRQRLVNSFTRRRIKEIKRNVFQLLRSYSKDQAYFQATWKHCVFLIRKQHLRVSFFKFKKMQRDAQQRKKVLLTMFASIRKRIRYQQHHNQFVAFQKLEKNRLLLNHRRSICRNLLKKKHQRQLYASFSKLSQFTRHASGSLQRQQFSMKLMFQHLRQQVHNTLRQYLHTWMAQSKRVSVHLKERNTRLRICIVQSRMRYLSKSFQIWKSASCTIALNDVLNAQESLREETVGRIQILSRCFHKWETMKHHANIQRAVEVNEELKFEKLAQLMFARIQKQFWFGSWVRLVNKRKERKLACLRASVLIWNILQSNIGKQKCGTLKQSFQIWKLNTTCMITEQRLRKDALETLKKVEKRNYHRVGILAFRRWSLHRSQQSVRVAFYTWVRLSNQKRNTTDHLIPPAGRGCMRLSMWSKEEMGDTQKQRYSAIHRLFILFNLYSQGHMQRSFQKWRSYILQERCQHSLLMCKEKVSSLFLRQNLLARSWHHWTVFLKAKKQINRTLQVAIRSMKRLSVRSVLREVFSKWMSHLAINKMARSHNNLKLHVGRAEKKNTPHVELDQPRTPELASTVCQDGNSMNFSFSEQLSIWRRRRRRMEQLGFHFRVWHHHSLLQHANRRTEYYLKRNRICALQNCKSMVTYNNLRLRSAFQRWETCCRLHKGEYEKAELKSLLFRMRITHKLRNGRIDTTKV